jgi:superfamily II DNA or RNA helicase
MDYIDQLCRKFPQVDKSFVQVVYKGCGENLQEAEIHLAKYATPAKVASPPNKIEDTKAEIPSQVIAKHPPRGYQIELAAAGEKENSIVVLPTGAGKTYIAVLLATKVHEKNPKKSNKHTKPYYLLSEILFIVDRVNLVYQQATSFEEHSKLKVGKLHGDIVDKEWDFIKVS